MSVVAQAGGWTASSSTIPQPVAATETAALVTSRSVSVDAAESDGPSVTPGGDERVGREADDGTDGVAADDARRTGVPAPTAEGEDERRGAEARKDERLAGRPRDAAECGDEQAGGEPRFETASRHVTRSVDAA